MGPKELRISREKILFQFLEEESKNVLVGAVSFSELIQNFGHLADKRNKVKDVEHHGDEIVHSIYDRLVKTFITPIDKGPVSKVPFFSLLGLWSSRRHPRHIQRCVSSSRGPTSLQQLSLD